MLSMLENIVSYWRHYKVINADEKIVNYKNSNKNGQYDAIFKCNNNLGDLCSVTVLCTEDRVIIKIIDSRVEYVCKSFKIAST